MAHFASIDKLTNKVIEVFVVNNSDILDEFGQESEDIGISYISSVCSNFPWINNVYFKQTNRVNGQKKNYAGIGYDYDLTRNAFIPPKPPGDWVLNESTCLWEEPQQLSDIKTNKVQS